MAESGMDDGEGAGLERIFAMSGSGRGKADAADRLVRLDGAEEVDSVMLLKCALELQLA